MPTPGIFPPPPHTHSWFPCKTNFLFQWSCVVLLPQMNRKPRNYVCVVCFSYRSWIFTTGHWCVCHSWKPSLPIWGCYNLFCFIELAALTEVKKCYSGGHKPVPSHLVSNSFFLSVWMLKVSSLPLTDHFNVIELFMKNCFLNIRLT